MLTGCFAGCKKTEETDETQISTAQGEDDPLVTLLPDKTYDKDFVILTHEGFSQDQYLVCHELNGEPLNQVSVDRTLYLEERFGINISVQENPDLTTLLGNAHMAGDREYDLIEPHPTDGIVNLMVSGYFANLLDMPYQYTDREWWNQSMVENYSTNGKLYLGVCDFTIASQSLLALVYNRDMYKAYGFTDDLHDVAMSGDFTVEYLKQILINCKSDGNIEEENATYGLLFQTNSSRRWMYALGQRILTKDAQGKFAVALESEPVTDLCSGLYGLLYQSGDVMVATTGANATFANSNYWATFKGGRALFSAYNVGSLYNLLRDLSFDVGYLPLPKLDEDQNEYLVVEASGMVALPALMKDEEMSSVVLEALAICSYQDMRPAFFETILMGRLSENPDDYEMLEFLHESKFYDFGFTLDSDSVALGIINFAVVNSQNPDSAARYLSSNKRALNAIADLANTIQ